MNLSNNFDPTTALLIFLAYIIIDGLFAYYTQMVISKKPLLSATSGALIHFLLAFGVINYVQNYLYIIPLALGSWVGTYLVVKRISPKQKTLN